jgi:hypothetical protein
MTLAAGSKLGPYEIQSPLGAGGVDEVYSEALCSYVPDQTICPKVRCALYVDFEPLLRLSTQSNSIIALAKAKRRLGVPRPGC